MRRTPLLSLLLLSLSTTGCDGGAEALPRTPGTYEMTLSGRHVLQASGQASTSIGRYGVPTRQILLGDGHAPGVSFIRAYDTNLVSGTFSLGFEPGQIQTFLTLSAPGGVETLWVRTGTLTLTRVEGRRMAGTFRFTARSFPDVDPAAPSTLAEGRFEVPVR